MKVKSCSCRACKRGRHLYRKSIERKARRSWNKLAKQHAELVLLGEEPTVPFSFFGGGYTD